MDAHIFPRYDCEPKEQIPYPVWRYTDEQYQYDGSKHGVMKSETTRHLLELIKQAYRRSSKEQLNC
ncbi:hypothetical protein ACI7RC_06010 [Brevibacillus sp. B_LB10_24]|uniref:hypothetical protein n=1 Tax=Brevibacillus sp. B_LB10_24 TaxID=3380645 RepID=UPI0038B8E8F9